MSWTSVFPVLSDEMVGQYEAEATAAEKAELAEWFAVKTVINAKPETRHVASFSLFWKNPRQDDPDLPVLDRKTLKHAKRRGKACFHLCRAMPAHSYSLSTLNMLLGRTLAVRSFILAWPAAADPRCRCRRSPSPQLWRA